MNPNDIDNQCNNDQNQMNQNSHDQVDRMFRASGLEDFLLGPKNVFRRLYEDARRRTRERRRIEREKLEGEQLLN